MCSTKCFLGTSKWYRDSQKGVCMWDGLYLDGKLFIMIGCSSSNPERKMLCIYLKAEQKGFWALLWANSTLRGWEVRVQYHETQLWRHWSGGKPSEPGRFSFAAIWARYWQSSLWPFASIQHSGGCCAIQFAQLQQNRMFISPLQSFYKARNKPVRLPRCVHNEVQKKKRKKEKRRETKLLSKESLRRAQSFRDIQLVFLRPYCVQPSRLKTRGGNQWVCRSARS